jgi:hypothetical protein
MIVDGADQEAGCDRSGCKAQRTCRRLAEQEPIDYELYERLAKFVNLTRRDARNAARVSFSTQTSSSRLPG